MCTHRIDGDKLTNNYWQVAHITNGARCVPLKKRKLLRFGWIGRGWLKWSQQHLTVYLGLLCFMFYSSASYQPRLLTMLIFL
jgi:hypothetical protein